MTSSQSIQRGVYTLKNSVDIVFISDFLFRYFFFLNKTAILKILTEIHIEMQTCIFLEQLKQGHAGHCDEMSKSFQMSVDKAFKMAVFLIVFFYAA